MTNLLSGCLLINIKMKKKLIFLFITILLVGSLSFVYSEGGTTNKAIDIGEGLVLEDISVFGIGVEAEAITPSTNKVEFTGIGLGEGESSYVKIGDVEFPNIKSGFMKFYKDGKIKEANYVTGDGEISHWINKNEFIIPANSRFIFDGEKGFILAEGTEVKNVGSSARISGENLKLWRGEKQYDVSGSLNFDENGQAYVKGSDEVIISKTKILESISDVNLYFDEVFDASEHLDENYYFYNGKEMKLHSTRYGGVNIEVLARNDILNTNEYDKLTIEVFNGDGIEITKGIKPRILQKSSEEGVTFIQNGGLYLSLDEEEIAVAPQQISVDDLLSKRYRSVPVLISSNSENIMEQLEIDSYGKASLVDSSGVVATYYDDISGELLNSGLKHEDLEKIAYTLKENIKEGDPNDALHRTTDILRYVGDGEFNKDQAVNLITKTIEISKDKSSSALSAIGWGLARTNNKLDSNQFTDFSLKTLEKAIKGDSLEEIDYSYDLLGKAIDDNLNLDLTLDFIDKSSSLDYTKEGISLISHSGFLRDSLNEFNGENFDDITQGIKIVDRYGVGNDFAYDFDLKYTNIKDKQTLAKEYVSALDNYFEKGDIEGYPLRTAAHYINKIHDFEGELESSDSIREAIARDLNFESKYYLISQANEVLYPSTFEKLYNNFPDNLVEQIRQTDPKGNYWMDFSVVLSSKGKLNTLLKEDPSFFSDTIKKGLSVNDKEELFKNSILIADTITEFYENPEYYKEKKDIEDFLIKKYKQPETNEQKAIYSYFLKLNENPLNDEIKKITKELPEIVNPILPEKYLNKKTIAGKLYFYDDEPWFGITRDEYDKNPKYDMHLIKSTDNEAILTKSINDKTIEIALELIPHTQNANSAEAIEGDYYVLISHRGHCYHLDQTFSSDSLSEKICYNGGCGGFGDVPILQEKYPRAHIISDKGIAKGDINNRAIYEILEDIAKGKISWDELKPDFAKEEELVFPDDTGQLLRMYMNQFELLIFILIF